MKWLSAIFEGIAGFVIWSFVGFWLVVILVTPIHAFVELPRKTVLIIGFSTAGVVGFVMAGSHARRDLASQEGRGKRERSSFLDLVAFALFALAWAALILIVQIGKRH